jgi:hypothetical protein
MMLYLRHLIVVGALLLPSISIDATAFAQKPGGVLRVLAGDSPPRLACRCTRKSTPSRRA